MRLTLTAFRKASFKRITIHRKAVSGRARQIFDAPAFRHPSIFVDVPPAIPYGFSMAQLSDIG